MDADTLMAVGIVLAVLAAFGLGWAYCRIFGRPDA